MPLDRLIELSRVSSTRNEHGESVETVTALGTVWATRIDATLSDVEEEGGTRGELRRDFRIRWRHDVAALTAPNQIRVTENNVVFNSQRVAEDTDRGRDRNRFILIQCIAADVPHPDTPDPVSAVTIYMAIRDNQNENPNELTATHFTGPDGTRRDTNTIEAPAYAGTDMFITIGFALPRRMTGLQEEGNTLVPNLRDYVQPAEGAVDVTLQINGQTYFIYATLTNKARAGHNYLVTMEAES